MRITFVEDDAADPFHRVVKELSDAIMGFGSVAMDQAVTLAVCGMHPLARGFEKVATITSDEEGAAPVAMPANPKFADALMSDAIDKLLSDVLNAVGDFLRLAPAPVRSAAVAVARDIEDWVVGGLELSGDNFRDRDPKKFPIGAIYSSTWREGIGSITFVLRPAAEPVTPSSVVKWRSASDRLINHLHILLTAETPKNGKGKTLLRIQHASDNHFHMGDEDEGTWVGPFTKKAIARAMGEDPRSLERLLGPTGFIEKARQKWTVRVDTIGVDKWVKALEKLDKNDQSNGT